jgi:hypothetical protein
MLSSFNSCCERKSHQKFLICCEQNRAGPAEPARRARTPQPYGRTGRSVECVNEDVIARATEARIVRFIALPCVGLRVSLLLDFARPGSSWASGTWQASEATRRRLSQQKRRVVLSSNRDKYRRDAEFGKGCHRCHGNIEGILGPRLPSFVSFSHWRNVRKAAARTGCRPQAHLYFP